ncbi:cache domain-containing protein, partial [bacterium]|nr:cache domain-containing protein [bacterium]
MTNKIRWKILVLGFSMVLLSTVLLGGILSWTIVSQAKSDIIKFEETAIKKRKQELKEKSDLAYSAIRTLYTDAVEMRSHGITVPESQITKNMISLINKLRFGEDKNEYFWIHSYNENDQTDITMIMHPVIPSMQGDNLSELRYTSGNLIGEIVYATGINEKIPFVRYMNKIVSREGGGFVSYDWPRPIQSGLTEYQPKISYV